MNENYEHCLFLKFIIEFIYLFKFVCWSQIASHWIKNIALFCRSEVFNVWSPPKTRNKGITWEHIEKANSQALPHSYPVRNSKSSIHKSMFFNIPSDVSSAHSSLRVTAQRKSSAADKHLLWKIKFDWSTVTPILSIFSMTAFAPQWQSWVVATGT